MSGCYFCVQPAVLMIRPWWCDNGQVQVLNVNVNQCWYSVRHGTWEEKGWKQVNTDFLPLCFFAPLLCIWSEMINDTIYGDIRRKCCFTALSMCALAIDAQESGDNEYLTKLLNKLVFYCPLLQDQCLSYGQWWWISCMFCFFHIEGLSQKCAWYNREGIICHVSAL